MRRNEIDGGDQSRHVPDVQRKYIFGLFATIVTLVAGCIHGGHTTRGPVAPTYVFNPPSEQAVNARATVLEKQGYSPTAAMQRARIEAASQTWQYNRTDADAAERVRRERQQASDAMNKALANLDLKD